MVDEDLELERDIGEATIVYDEPEEDAVRKTVPNEHIVYFQDHWIIKAEEDEEGNDIVRRIPARRVHYVERSVEEFEEEVKTIRNQVQSFADTLRSKLPGSDDDSDGHTDVEVVEGDSDS